MEIILLQDVENLGKRGEVANVSAGYGRNFLFPRKLAEIATPGKIAAVQKIVEEKAAQERRIAEQAEETRELLSKTVITIAAPVGAGDRLFGSVTSQDIATAIYTARKIRVDKRGVDLGEAIKTVGTYMIKVEVHPSVEPADVKVMVVPEDSKA
ncbi:MAG TPA: 50S ribosomal protein L9 [Thermoleophilia bacterium]|jgi:large subunit ribosomal protein L9